ncbi:DUF5017 domain-containing protein [Sabulilitoribacter multivorans]|uniref:DUF5017 domain-containing protein n=1 Tax=Flaviramulus multivorans TaxID=1304750 RepID=A0ABS9IH89_9FLAO|nr:choice-of-anchor J domain-containing protein [Flaviramulus multivorans]MCF7559775.1 DUF5017 domain-containing protein [Flaviramulus multivorans]
MKYIYFYLLILGVALTSCNPMEDIYNDIDAKENPIVGEATYVLTSEDYDDLGLTFGNFSSEDDAKALLPDFLSDLYPSWGKGSAVTVGYKLFIGNAEGVSDYSGADVYQLTNADYASTGSDAFGFYPNVDATDEIPGVLATQIAGAADGDIVLARYAQYFDNPVVGLANLVEYNFAGSLAGWTAVETSPATGGNDVWTSQSGYVQGNGFFGGAVANEEWLVSPSIDLSGESNLKLQITQEIDFLSVPDQIDIMVSTDYAGDLSTATWTALSFDKTAFGSMTASPDYDFSAYDGQTINIAFKYVSSDTDAGRWRVANLAIKVLGATGDTNKKGEFFMYDGTEWEEVDGVYFLSSADFDSMGEGSGQPGRFNNFGSSTPAEDYLPTFLSITAPYAYAQEEDEVIMVYDYFSSSSGAQIRGNRYTVIDGKWTPHTSVISTSLQFGHDGNSWVPDNTIRYMLTGADITFISNAFSSIYPGPADNVGFFGSFDRRSSSSNFWSDAMLLEAFNALLENGNFVTAEGQKYLLTYVIYNGSTTNESKSVIKTGGEWVYQ